MELSLQLVKQIGAMFIMLAMGAALVKTKLLKTEQSRVVSVMLLYVIVPCTILNAFNIEFEKEKLLGLALAAGGAVVCHILFIGISRLLKKPLKLSSVERAAICYPNVGNLVIPLIAATMGSEWVFYASAFMVVQLFCIWTHGRMMISEEKTFSLKKVLLNVNVIAAVAGFIMFVCQVRLPPILGPAIESMAATIAPLSMVVIGMILAGMSWKEILGDKRAYLVTALRLVVFPLVIVLVYAFSGAHKWLPQGKDVLIISLFAASSSTAATITQFAQLYQKEEQHAGVIGVMTVLGCIVTLPAMVWLYQILIGLMG